MASRYNNYTEREMMRMQQDAARRVREMQNRARLTVEEANDYNAPPPSNYNGRNYRNWSTNPNVQRQRSQGNSKEEEPVQEKKRVSEPPPPPEPPLEPPRAETIKEPTTLIQDILGAVGLDDDRLLIVGLLFMLINAKADTTLILALVYLLI